MNYVSSYITVAIREMESALASISGRIAEKQGDIDALLQEQQHVAAAIETLRAFDVRGVDTRSSSLAQFRAAPEAPAALPTVDPLPPQPRSEEDWRHALLTFLVDGPRPPADIRRFMGVKDPVTMRRRMTAMAEAGLASAEGATHSRRWLITEAGRLAIGAPPHADATVVNHESRIVNTETAAPVVEPFEPDPEPDEPIDDAADVDEDEPPAPEPPPLRAKAYPAGHRQLKPATEKVASGPSWWLGKGREELTTAALERAESMSASREARDRHRRRAEVRF